MLRSGGSPPSVPAPAETGTPRVTTATIAAAAPSRTRMVRLPSVGPRHHRRRCPAWECYAGAPPGCTLRSIRYRSRRERCRRLDEPPPASRASGAGSGARLYPNTPSRRQTVARRGGFAARRARSRRGGCRRCLHPDHLRQRMRSARRPTETHRAAPLLVPSESRGRLQRAATKRHSGFSSVTQRRALRG